MKFLVMKTKVLNILNEYMRSLNPFLQFGKSGYILQLFVWIECALSKFGNAYDKCSILLLLLNDILCINDKGYDMRQ